jgi:hypothetical protein
MDLKDIFSQPVLRRSWLLNKALENASFDEALKLAQVADEFLRVDKLETNAPILTEPVARGSHGAHYDADPLQNILSLPVECKSDHLHLTNIGSDAEQTVIVELRRSFEGSSDELPGDLRGKREVASQVSVEKNSLVLASQEEVVRYLRQRDDVVVPAGPNAFLVNGRFRLNFDEMVMRANKMRERQGKPLFEPMLAN